MGSDDIDAFHDKEIAPPSDAIATKFVGCVGIVYNVTVAIFEKSPDTDYTPPQYPFIPATWKSYVPPSINPVILITDDADGECG